MEKKYDLWFNNKISKEWFKIGEFLSKEEVEKELKLQLNDVYFYSVNSSVFKICDFKDITWMKNIPSYLLVK